MKVLGIDFGTKKIGIALSDDEGSFAFPMEIVSREDAFDRITQVCKEEQVDRIVIGKSLASNEGENILFVQAEAFGKKVETEINVPVVFEREDFSSVEAHRYQTSAGNRDDSAAAIILQRYLDKRKT